MFNLFLRLCNYLRGPYIGVHTDYLADKVTELRTGSGWGWGEGGRRGVRGTAANILA